MRLQRLEASSLPCWGCSRKVRRTSVSPRTTSSSHFATTSGQTTRQATESSRLACAIPSARRRSRSRRHRNVAHGRIRGGRRSGRRGTVGRERSSRGTGDHLHARQGSFPMRERHAHRPVGSTQARDATNPVSLKSSGSRQPRFPTILPLWAIPPMAIPGCRDGAPNRRPRCSRSFSTSKLSRRITASGT